MKLPNEPREIQEHIVKALGKIIDGHKEDDYAKVLKNLDKFHFNLERLTIMAQLYFNSLNKKVDTCTEFDEVEVSDNVITSIIL